MIYLYFWWIPEFKCDATPCGLGNAQGIPPGAADWGDIGISKDLGRITVHPSLNSNNVLRRPACSRTARECVSRACFAIAIVNCSIFNLLLVDPSHRSLVRISSAWKFDLKVRDNSLKKVAATLSLCILYHEKVSLVLGKLRPWRHDKFWNKTLKHFNRYQKLC